MGSVEGGTEIATKTMSDAAAFGVGCFQFTYQRPPPFTLRGADYLSALEEALESVSSIDKIRIQADKLLEDLEVEIDSPFTEIKQGRHFFPQSPAQLDIRFEIFIPRRVQEDLFHWGPGPGALGERFRVQIHYSYFFPVTYVEALKPGPRFDPSDGVIVVRKFLARHFSEDTDNPISFEALGPSPFHAEFLLSGQDGVQREPTDDRLACVITRERGYDTVEFFFDRTVYEDSEMAKAAVFSELADELGLYYRVVHERLVQMVEWEAVQTAYGELLETYASTGLTARWKRIFTVYGQIQDVIIALSGFESSGLWREHELKSYYEGLLRGGKRPFLVSHLDEELGSIHNYPTAQFRDVVMLLEGRRAKLADALVVVLAAILGGSVGALIALAATNL